MRDPALKKLFMGQYRNISALIDQMIEEGVANGDFNPVDSPRLAVHIPCLVQGIGMYWYMCDGGFDIDRLFETVRNKIKKELIAHRPPMHPSRTKGRRAVSP